MFFAGQGGLVAAVTSAAAGWPMSFSSVHYLLFLPLAVGGYFVLPQKLRRPFLLLASYYFYFFAAPKYLVVLLGGTLVSFLCGLFIAAGKTRHGKTRRLVFSVALLVLGLCFFKYNGFFASFLSPLFKSIGINYSGGYFATAAALGISFYTFTAIDYLIDSARGDVPPEKNLLDYALFLGFFPSVTMGPISRAGGLLPQLKDTARRFDAAGAAASLRLMGIGFFKKLAVADTLAVFTNGVYGSLGDYSGPTLTVAAVAFALQLYFDFSGYTDIARASAGLLGIKLPQNFQNPFFSTNYSSFWARWHISLSSWLQDYIFTPLVWSRWTEKLPFIGKKVTKPPVLSAIAVTFLISGIWHGDTLCFLVWGALQAAFRIGEELLHRTLGKPKKHPSFWARAGKTAVVLVLWVESLVFFKVGMMEGGTVGAAFSALGRQFSLGGSGLVQNVFATVKAGFYQDDRIAAAFIAFSLFCLVLALWADWAECFRLKGAGLSAALGGLKGGRRWALYILLCLCCFAGFIAQSGGFGGSSFLYGGF